MMIVAYRHALISMICVPCLMVRENFLFKNRLVIIRTNNNSKGAMITGNFQTNSTGSKPSTKILPLDDPPCATSKISQMVTWFFDINWIRIYLCYYLIVARHNIYNH